MGGKQPITSLIRSLRFYNSRVMGKRLRALILSILLVFLLISAQYLVPSIPADMFTDYYSTNVCDASMNMYGDSSWSFQDSGKTFLASIGGMVVLGYLLGNWVSGDALSWFLPTNESLFSGGKVFLKSSVVLVSIPLNVSVRPSEPSRIPVRVVNYSGTNQSIEVVATSEDSDVWFKNSNITGVVPAGNEEVFGVVFTVQNRTMTEHATNQSFFVRRVTVKAYLVNITGIGVEENELLSMNTVTVYVYPEYSGQTPLLGIQEQTVDKITRYVFVSEVLFMIFSATMLVVFVTSVVSGKKKT